MFAEQQLQSAKHPTTNKPIWMPRQSARLRATFPWQRGIQVWQTVYAGEHVINSEARKDSILYRVDGEEYYGILQAIFQHNCATTSRYALIRRLKQVKGEPGNLKVVDEFGNKRYAYCRDGIGILIDFVPRSSFVGMAMIVPDLWTCSKVFGSKKRMKYIPDNQGTQKKRHFFEVMGFKHTSISEQVKS